MLELNYIKSIFIFISFLIIFLTVASVLLNVMSKMSRSVFSIIMSGIDLSNLLYAIYLSSIWLVDTYYKEIFMVKEELWRSDKFCFTAFGIILCYTLTT